jgi:hypothetical protein
MIWQIWWINFPKKILFWNFRNPLLCLITGNFLLRKKYASNDINGINSNYVHDFEGANNATINYFDLLNKCMDLSCDRS